MTVQEAKCQQCNKKCPQEKLASDIAKGRMYATNEFIQCQKELEQYRALGTVEELKEAMEKQVAKKPIMKKREHILHYECPCCGFTTLLPHCGNCGQKIDWEEGGTSD